MWLGGSLIAVWLVAIIGVCVIALIHELRTQIIICRIQRQIDQWHHQHGEKQMDVHPLDDDHYDY